MIQQRVTKYIEKEHLFSPDDKILVALSGGADSVALLYILWNILKIRKQKRKHLQLRKFWRSSKIRKSRRNTINFMRRFKCSTI